MFYFEFIKNKKVMKSSVLKGLEHFFTTRESIIKTKEYSYEQLAYDNRKDFCEYYHINRIISPKQTHSSNVCIVSDNVFEYPETDGLVLTKQGALALNFADCTPLIFFDDKIAAVSHAGWRGTAAKIAQKTIDIMVNELNSKVENINFSLEKKGIINNSDLETSYESD